MIQQVIHTVNPLHKELGRKTLEEFGSNALLDSACGEGHNLPLFYSEEKSCETESCNADMLILKDGKVKVVFEITETNVRPTQICGKMLTSALSKYYIYRDKKYLLASSTMFIQVIFASKLKNKSGRIPNLAILKKQYRKACD
jgi:hypothetical protein